MGVLEDQQTKSIVGSKKQVIRELLGITETTAHAFLHQEAKLVMTANWI